MEKNIQILHSQLNAIKNEYPQHVFEQYDNDMGWVENRVINFKRDYNFFDEKDVIAYCSQIEKYFDEILTHSNGEQII